MRQAQEGFRGGGGEFDDSCRGWGLEVLGGESEDIVLFLFSFFDFYLSRWKVWLVWRRFSKSQHIEIVCQ